MSQLSTETLDQVINNAKNWIINSGIQNTSSEMAAVKGGFNSWYDIDNESYFYTYSEISGYSISTLLFMDPNGRANLSFLRAVLAAEWLIDKASHKSGGVKTRYYFDRENAPEFYDFSSGIVHSFDNGIALTGLLDIHKTSNEPRYLKTAIRIGNLLLDVMQKDDGGLYATYSHRDESYKDSGEKWSTQSGSYHSKCAMGLLKLHAATGENRYRDAAVRLCEYALLFQKPDGRFVSYKEEGDTHFHPHCYSAEGLLYAGVYLKQSKYLECAAKSVQAILDLQMENGGIPSMFVGGKPVAQERSDILSQTLRLGIAMSSLGMLNSSYSKKLHLLAERLVTLQYTNKDFRGNGGFLFGHDVAYRGNLKADKKNHLNTWCTFFALQALTFYKDFYHGKFEFDKDTLFI